MEYINFLLSAQSIFDFYLYITLQKNSHLDFDCIVYNIFMTSQQAHPQQNIECSRFDESQNPQFGYFQFDGYFECDAQTKQNHIENDIDQKGPKPIYKGNPYRKYKKSKLPKETQQKQPPKIIILDANDKKTIQLNQSNTSYITIEYLPQHLRKHGLQTFDRMWNLHPEDKHRVIMYQKQIEVHRYSKSYLNTPVDLSHTVDSSYMYSGYKTENNRQDLPAQFRPFYEQIQNKDGRYNQVTANWYKDQNDFIAPHSDCQRGMIENASICIVSLYASQNAEGFRFMEITPRVGAKALSDRVVIRMDHGLVLTMHGDMQKEFRHKIEKQSKEVSARISLSFRQMIV